MKRNQRAIRIPAAALLVAFAMVAFPVAGLPGEDAQAERESRRIEAEARRQQELARRDMESRERAQEEALRGQEEALRRIEATRSRIESSTQQINRESVEQERLARYPYGSPDAARQDPILGMVLAPLERLGRYFGAQSGVLVVRAGAHAPYGLQDGDVIHSIDGRAPIDDQHAAGILRSYRAGERVKLRIHRDRLAIDLDTKAPGP